MHCKRETTIYSVVTVLTEGFFFFFLHLLVDAAACLYSAAYRPQPHRYSLDLRPAKENFLLNVSKH